MRRFFQKVYSQNPIFAAKCGQKAIEEYPMPHMMLVNLQKPPAHGFALVEWIRQQPGLGAIELIVLTPAEKLSRRVNIPRWGELSRIDFSNA